MKSPSAPPRITRMRFIFCCRGRCPQRRGGRPAAGTASRYKKLVTRECEGENCRAVKQHDRMHEATTDHTARTPIDLITQQVGHCYPKKSGDDQQVSENRDKQSARLVTKETCLEKRFSGEQTKNAESANREKFGDE